jgi:3-mercaptopyruvate sulfurtransferase SseA
MMEMGFGRVLALKGGWREWERKGLPTEPR